jgi:hypothetical protein
MARDELSGRRIAPVRAATATHALARTAFAASADASL